MCSRRDRLCAVVFTALCYTVTAKQLDMALDAVDDLYFGCRAQVLEKVITSGLLTEELSRSEEFQKAWKANTQCSTLIRGGEKEHTAALLTYAYGGRQFRKNFNDAVETMGVNVSTYQDNFHFKSLHFLLVDLMKILNKKGCKTVYSVSKTKYTARKGSTVRFGRFTSAQADYRDLKEDPDLEDGTFFNITSCYVTNVEANTCNQEGEIEQLLSPAEMFTVEEIRDVDDDYKYTEIVLKHSKLHSTHDCYVYSASPAVSSTLWLVLVLLAFSCVLFTC